MEEEEMDKRCSILIASFLFLPAVVTATPVVSKADGIKIISASSKEGGDINLRMWSEDLVSHVTIESPRGDYRFSYGLERLKPSKSESYVGFFLISSLAGPESSELVRLERLFASSGSFMLETASVRTQPVPVSEFVTEAKRRVGRQLGRLKGVVRKASNLLNHPHVYAQLSPRFKALADLFQDNRKNQKSIVSEKSVDCGTACGTAVGCAVAAGGMSVGTGGLGGAALVSACSGAAGGCGVCVGNLINSLL